MKIGIIYTCYGNPEYIDNCISPWIEAKKSHDILIAAVHGQFKEYRDIGIEDNDTDTQKLLLDKLVNKDLDFLYIQNEYNNEKIYQTEAEIRDKGLQWLLKQNCDYIWLLDNDEFYTAEQINNIITYIEKEQFITWFSIPFKNYIFSGKEWIYGFCPPRIFKVKLDGPTLHRCYWDNDFEYKIIGGTPLGNVIISYKNLSNKSIPPNILNGGIRHLTWLHSNGKLKYEYQMKHFGHCGYKWNYETNQLEFNKEFHQKNNITIPEIFKDE